MFELKRSRRQGKFYNKRVNGKYYRRKKYKNLIIKKNDLRIVIEFNLDG